MKEEYFRILKEQGSTKYYLETIVLEKNKVISRAQTEPEVLFIVLDKFKRLLAKKHLELQND
jgi:hypothetical protein